MPWDQLAIACPLGIARVRRAALSPIRFLNSSDIDLRFQRAVHRTFVSNFHELCALFSIKVTFERNYALNSIEHPRLRFAFGTICGVSPPVSEADLCPRQPRRCC